MMRSMRRQWLPGISAAVLLVGVLVSCGGGSKVSLGVSSKEQPYVDALAESIRKDDSFPGGAENSSCLAAGMINIIGLDTLEEANIKPEDFAGSANLDLSAVGSKKVDRLVEFFFSGQCVDMVQFFADSMRSEAGETVSNEQARCVAEKVLAQDSFRQAFRTYLVGNEDASKLTGAMGDVFGFMSDCGVSADSFTSS